MGTRFSEAYVEISRGLASRDFSADKDWQKLVVRARKLVAIDGFDAGESGVVGDLRKTLAKGVAQGTNEAVAMLKGSGETLSGKGANARVDAALALRLGALKTLRHTYLLKRFGGHKVWCVDFPPRSRRGRMMHSPVIWRSPRVGSMIATNDLQTRDARISATHPKRRSSGCTRR